MNAPTKQREFFNWTEYKDAGLIVAGGLSIIVAGRNIGKTTGILIDILMNHADAENMVFFGRNTLKEIEAYAKSFNAQYAGKMQMSHTAIYRLEKEILVNKKTGEETIKYKRAATIGYVGALSGTDGWRSANFDKVKFVIFDEYNQIGNSLDTQKFITLWTSILRTRKDVFTIIIGNRDDASAELNIELSIDVNIPPEHVGDWVYQISDDDDFKDKMFYVDCDDNRFTNYQHKTAWKVLGNITQVMGDYYNRGYKSYANVDCYKLKPDQMKQVKWEWAYHYDEWQIVKGNLNGLVIIHLDINKQINTSINYGDIDLIHKSKHLVKPNIALMYDELTTAMQNENILYTSIAAKEDINIILDNLINQIDDKIFKI